MARFQALQQEENAKLMSSLCFLKESITDQDLESTDLGAITKEISFRGERERARPMSLKSAECISFLCQISDVWV